jgi:hypothetical protein
MNYKLRIGIGYLMSSLLLGVFSIVYLSFVPGVFNLWMVSVFSIPLLGSVLELWLRKKDQLSLGWTLYRLGLSTFAVQLILKGVYDIALTSFKGEIYFFLAAILLFVIGIWIQSKE